MPDMINPQKGIDLMNNKSIINRILFAVTIFQHSWGLKAHKWMLQPQQGKKKLKICTRKKGHCLWRHPDRPIPRGILLFHMDVGPRHHHNDLGHHLELGFSFWRHL
jgi:hypothetical protein